MIEGIDATGAVETKERRKAAIMRDIRRQSTLLKKKDSLETVTLNDFECIRELGRGAFGRVFLGFLPSSDKYYAIKAIRKDKVINNDMIEQVMFEKDILDLLFKTDHPFLCGVDYFFQTQLRLYFVMPFISGGELTEVFRKLKRFTEDTAKFYIAQIIIGVQKLHDLGIIHRDLKLENCMVDSNGYVKVIDFGVSRILG